MKNKDFCIFILTHGRPDRVYTYNNLIKRGYTGKIFIVIDNEDKKRQEYLNNFGDKVIVFDKLKISKQIDEADNFNDQRAIVYARNVCFDIAEKMNILYFMQLDDDYIDFQYRINDELMYPKNHFTVIKNLDNIFDCLLDFYKNTKFHSIAIAQGGDFIGGGHNGFVESLCRRRKCMNTFICSTKRRFVFNGRLNEDVNTYTYQQSKGITFFTFPYLSIKQKQTQSNSEGMTNIYLNVGTYVKSFYSILYHPSSVKIGLMGRTNKRLHHHISWKNTVPLIISENFKK